MKSGLIPVFTLDQIYRKVDDFNKKRLEQIHLTLSYIGEKFVNDARTVGNYRDRTGNLRSSIGYVIGYNGEIKKRNFRGKSLGKAKAKEVSELVLKHSENGFVLIVVAGMEYAAAVESKGYDVISNSVPMKSKLKDFMDMMD